MGRTIVYLSLLVLVAFVAGASLHTMFAGATVGAVVLDVAAEWRARRRAVELETVWEEHRVHALDPALEALRDEGIDAHARGLHHRALLHAFGPFVPVHLMVPVDHAARARRLLADLLGGRAG